ncbi:MAG: YfcC family protein [Saprospiraceae bacterium]|nr:YfcC family protein [Saprospiraceae bacterium]
MLFGMLVVAGLLSWIIPAGKFDRELIDGKEVVVSGSFHYIASNPLSILDIFLAIPLGFRTATDIIFIVLASGIMFGFIEDSKAFENGVGVMVRKLGTHRSGFLIMAMTFGFGMFGVFVGYENNIALIPIAALVSLAIGGDLMLAAGIAVGAVTIGFGLSPFNPYTIGTGQKLAQLPLFSGAWLRLILCFIALLLLSVHNLRYYRSIIADPARSLSKDINPEGLALSKCIGEYRLSGRQRGILILFLLSIAVILYGVFELKWFIQHIAAIFCLLAVLTGLINRNSGRQFGEITLKSVGLVAPGAFMVGFATSIKAALEMGNISDTISYNLAFLLQTMPKMAAAGGMAISQTFMNFLIPSGSGQALATLPVLIPVGELLGLTRQTVVFAFQVGDGVSNLINPALGGLIAMLAMCRIPLDRWLRFIFPYFLIIWLIAILFTALSVAVHYGPF